MDDAKLFLRSWLQGTFLSTAAFGGNVVFGVLNFNLLWNRLKSDTQQNGRSSKETKLLLVYTVLIMLFCTAIEAVEVYVTLPGHVPSKGSANIAKSHPNGSFQFLFEGIPSLIGNTGVFLVHWSVSILLVSSSSVLCFI